MMSTTSGVVRRRWLATVTFVLLLYLFVLGPVGSVYAASDSITVTGVGAFDEGPPDPEDTDVANQLTDIVVSDDVVDGLGVVDMTVDVTGTGTFTLTLFNGKPVGVDEASDAIDVKYYDLFVEDASLVGSIVVRLYYTEYESILVNEGQMYAVWWTGSEWVECSNQTNYGHHSPGYGGYIEVYIDGTTSPTLSELTGTEVGLTGPTEDQIGMYYLCRILPYIFVALCMLALVGFMFAEGVSIVGMIVGAVIAIIAVIGAMVIQDVLWEVFVT